MTWVGMVGAGGLARAGEYKAACGAGCGSGGMHYIGIRRGPSESVKKR